MLLLEPADFCRNRRRAGFHAPVIALDDRSGGRGLRLRVVEQEPDIVVQSALISFQRQRVIALLLHDLPGDGAFQSQHFQQLGHGGDLVRLGVCGYLRQHQALFASPGAHHVQGRFAAGPIERAA